MPTVRRVMAYGNLSYHEAMSLPVDLFALMRKHSVVEELQSTEEGREYLAKCERLKQTEPDWKAVRSSTGYTAEEA